MSSQLSREGCQRLQVLGRRTKLYTAKHSELEQAKTKIAELTNDLEAKQVTMTAMSEENSHLRDMIGKLKVARNTADACMQEKRGQPEVLRRLLQKVTERNSELEGKVARFTREISDVRKQSELLLSKKDGEMKRLLEAGTEQKAELESQLRRMCVEAADRKRESEELAKERNCEKKRMRRELTDCQCENTKVRKELEAVRNNSVDLAVERYNFNQLLKEERSTVETMRQKVEEGRQKQSQLEIEVKNLKETAEKVGRSKELAREDNCEMKIMRRELADCQCENTKMRKELEAVLKVNVEMLMLRRVNNNVELTPERKEIDELLEKKDNELEVMRLEVEKGRQWKSKFERELGCLKKIAEKEAEEKKRVDELVREKDEEVKTMRLESEEGRLKHLQLEMELECLKKETAHEKVEKKKVDDLIREKDRQMKSEMECLKKEAAQKEEAEKKRADELMREADRIISEATRGYNTLRIEKNKVEEVLRERDRQLMTMRLEGEEGRKKRTQIERELGCVKKKTTQKEEAEKKRVEELVREADQAFAHANRGFNTLKIETLVYEIEAAAAMETIAAVEHREEGLRAQGDRLDKDKLAEAVTLMSSLESANRDLMEWTKEASVRMLSITPPSDSPDVIFVGVVEHNKQSAAKTRGPN